MDFSLSEDQRALQETAQRFAQTELAPFAAQWDLLHEFPIETFKKAGQLGFCGLYADPQWGGLGLSRLDAAILFEALSEGCTATTAYLTIHNMVTWMITTFAQASVKTQWAEALTQGEALGSYCLTEPNAGSDAASLQTRAVRVGDQYEITGQKAFISGAGSTDILIVMARTADLGAKGISAFVVPADTPGISFGENEKKLGWHCQPTRAVYLDKVTVPLVNRLGEEGEGFTIAMRALDGGRINIAACSLGTAKAAMNHTLAYVLDRKHFNQPLANFQNTQFEMADLTTNFLAAQQLVRYAAFQLDAQHSQARVFCAAAKRFATDTCFEICDRALQLHGGYGYLMDFPLERYLRDLRVHRILEGTNEVMRLVIAKQLFSAGFQALWGE